jgi:hypothetical protein
MAPRQLTPVITDADYRATAEVTLGEALDSHRGSVEEAFDPVRIEPPFTAVAHWIDHMLSLI